MSNCFSDTTLVNYKEGSSGPILESEIIETYSDSSQNIEMVHKTDDLGNPYTDNSDTFASSRPDVLADSNYEAYLNEYTYNNSDIIEPSHSDAVDITLPEDNKESGPHISEFQPSETADENLNDQTYCESQMTEEMLMNEREREKKSKKELEEEEREKMQ